MPDYMNFAQNWNTSAPPKGSTQLPYGSTQFYQKLIGDRFAGLNGQSGGNSVSGNPYLGALQQLRQEPGGGYIPPVSPQLHPEQQTAFDISQGRAPTGNSWQNALKGAEGYFQGFANSLGQPIMAGPDFFSNLNNFAKNMYSNWNTNRVKF